MWRGRRTWAPVAVIALLLGFAVASAIAQDGTQEEGPVTVIQEGEPEATATPIGESTTPAEEPTATVTPTVTPTATPTPDPRWRQNAAASDPELQRQEAEVSCKYGNLPTAEMFATGGAVGSDPGWPWGIVVLIAAVLVAAATYVLHRRRRATPAPTERQGEKKSDYLEVSGTVVAIVTGIVGLAGIFVPGLKTRDRPPPEATMEIRDVHARITHGEYNEALGLKELSSIDGREVGNVAWVRLQLRGYGGKTVKLQWASFDADRDSLIPGTVYDLDIAIQKGSEVQTIVQPVWVGHPRTQKFHVEFRLLEDGQVRELAKTSAMKAQRYRYVCPRRQ